MTGGYTGTLDLGGVSLVAPFGSALYLAKDDPAGPLLWAKSIAYETAGGAIGSRSVAADSAGNVAITGPASGGVNFGSGLPTHGDASIYVAKYGPQGRYLWAKRSANTGQCAGYGIARDQDRNVISIGFIQGEVNLHGLVGASPGQRIKSTFLYKTSP